MHFTCDVVVRVNVEGKRDRVVGPRDQQRGTAGSVFGDVHREADGVGASREPEHDVEARLGAHEAEGEIELLRTVRVGEEAGEIEVYGRLGECSGHRDVDQRQTIDHGLERDIDGRERARVDDVEPSDLRQWVRRGPGDRVDFVEDEAGPVVR